MRRLVPPGDPGLRVYETGPRGRTGSAAFAVVPDDVAEVRETLRWAYAHRMPLIPRGAGTGRAAAAIPAPSGAQAVLDLRGLAGDPQVDQETRIVTVDAGVTLAALDAALRPHGLTLPFAALPATDAPSVHASPSGALPGWGPSGYGAAAGHPDAGWWGLPTGDPLSARQPPAVDAPQGAPRGEAPWGPPSGEPPAQPWAHDGARSASAAEQPATARRGYGARTVGGIVGDGVSGRRVVPGGSLREALRGVAAVLADASATPVPLAARGPAYGGPDPSLLFTGARGTLGVVTAARFAVVPRPVATASAVLSFADDAAALSLFEALRRSAADLLTGFELASSGFGESRGPHALIRLADASGLLPVPLGTLLTTLVTAHAGGAGIAWLGDGEAEPPWPAPDDVVTELARSGTVVDVDVTVPPERVARLRAGTRALAAAVLPGARIADLGDALDGRWHLYVTWPSNRPEPAPERLGRLIARLHDLVVYGHLGTVAAVYAVGRDNTGYHLRVLPPAARRAVARVKSAFDPHNLLGTPRAGPPTGPVPSGR